MGTVKSLWPSQCLGQPKHICALNCKSKAMDHGFISQNQTQKQRSLTPQAVTISLAGPPACILHLPSPAKGDEVQPAGEGTKFS